MSHIDWTAVSRGPQDPAPPRRRSRRTLVTVGVAASVLAVTIVSGVAARTGDSLREGLRNGTATGETQIISKVTGERYGTRQSNVSSGANAGGAAIYGCRRPAKECTRHVNLSTGPAAAFVTAGNVPFTVSGSGLVANLNADKLDGLDAAQLTAATLAGKAASAGTADTAKRADSAASVDALKVDAKLDFVGTTAENADEATARSGASEVAITSTGPFTIYGKCFSDTDDGPGGVPVTRAEMYVRTSQSGALLDGGSDLLDGDPAFLDTGTAELDRQIDVAVTGAANSVEFEGDEEPVTLVAPDGTVHRLLITLSAKDGTPAGGNGLYGAGDRCGFQATAITG